MRQGPAVACACTSAYLVAVWPRFCSPPVPLAVQHLAIVLAARPICLGASAPRHGVPVVTPLTSQTGKKFFLRCLSPSRLLPPSQVSLKKGKGSWKGCDLRNSRSTWVRQESQCSRPLLTATDLRNLEHDKESRRGRGEQGARSRHPVQPAKSTPAGPRPACARVAVLCEVDRAGDCARAAALRSRGNTPRDRCTRPLPDARRRRCDRRW